MSKLSKPQMQLKHQEIQYSSICTQLLPTTAKGQDTNSQFCTQKVEERPTTRTDIGRHGAQEAEQRQQRRGETKPHDGGCRQGVRGRSGEMSGGRRHDSSSLDILSHGARERERQEGSRGSTTRGEKNWHSDIIKAQSTHLIVKLLLRHLGAQ